ncbi:MAG: hypothetical protein ACOX3K_00290 [Bacilli bacterium]|jgi:hypothetical protein
MKLREYLEQFKKFHGPYQARDFALSFAFLVVLLGLPVLAYFIGVFALIYLPLVIIPMYYATMHMINLRKRNDSLSKREFQFFFRQGLTKRIRKTFQLGKILLWSILVFLGASFIFGFVLGLTLGDNSPLIAIFNEIVDLMIKYTNGEATLADIQTYLVNHQQALFPFLFLSRVIPYLVTGLFIFIKIYHRAFFTFYASNFVISSYQQVESGTIGPYTQFKRQHAEMMVVQLILPISLFLLTFMGISYLLYRLEIYDVNINILFATMGGLIVLFPFYPFLMYGNGFMYDQFSKQHFVKLARSLQENARETKKLPGLHPEQIRRIDQVITELEVVIQTRVEAQNKNTDQPDGG